MLNRKGLFKLLKLFFNQGIFIHIKKKTTGNVIRMINVLIHYAIMTLMIV